MHNKPAINDMVKLRQHDDLRPGFDTAMFIETSNILQHQLFQNSPTMARLLTWLMKETLAGRGDSVKSYTIAVEALGRPEGFDSQIDSYPRVQTGRLRKSLETYYSRNGALRDLCIYLKPGSYRLRLAKLDVAYPQLYRPVSEGSASYDVEDVPPTPAPDRIVEFEKANAIKLGIDALSVATLSLILLLAAVIGFGLYFAG